MTEGTREEKLDAIIRRNGELMGAVVTADDPALAKAFGREELIDLLQPV